MAEHETRITVTADTSDAERKMGALERLMPHAFNAGITALNGLREGLNKVMGALGLFGLAVQGVNAVVGAVKALREWTERAANEAKKLRIELENAGYETYIARASDAYAKLNRRIAESVALEKEKSAIAAQRTATERTAEDAQAELDRQIALAALDPTRATYAEDKAEVERRFAREANERTYRRAEEDNAAQASELRGRADVRDADADALEAKWNAANAKVDELVERNFKAGMTARRTGTDEDKARAEETDRQWKAAYDFAQKIKAEMEKARQEAETLRNRAAELTGGSLAARTARDAANLALDTQQREADAAKAARKQAAARAAEDAQAELDRQIALAALDPTRATYAEDKAEVERRFAREANERTYRRAEEDNAAQASSDAATAGRDAAKAARKQAAARAAEDAQAELDRQAAIAALDPTRATYAEDKAEVERRFAREANERAYRRAEEDSAAQASSDAATAGRDAANLALDTQQREADAKKAAREQAAARAAEDAAAEFAAGAREPGDAAAEARGMLGGLLGATQAGGNRLTAMGLGDGTNGNRIVALGDDVRRLVELMRQNVEATKGIRTGGDGVAVYGE